MPIHEQRVWQIALHQVLRTNGTAAILSDSCSLQRAQQVYASGVVLIVPLLDPHAIVHLLPEIIAISRICKPERGRSQALDLCRSVRVSLGKGPHGRCQSGLHCDHFQARQVVEDLMARVDVAQRQSCGVMLFGDDERGIEREHGLHAMLGPLSFVRRLDFVKEWRQGVRPVHPRSAQPRKCDRDLRPQQLSGRWPLPAERLFNAPSL
mmetsp:Transcript_143582/g.400220  ORF Transcript_143582/g.400220 Transcript_143582/m.400220 type:complete len:208 (+) Transcript_143582:832-1455(+)